MRLADPTLPTRKARPNLRIERRGSDLIDLHLEKKNKKKNDCLQAEELSPFPSLLSQSITPPLFETSDF